MKARKRPMNSVEHKIMLKIGKNGPIYFTQWPQFNTFSLDPGGFRYLAKRKHSPKIAAPFVCASSQGQHTHFTRTNTH